MFVLFILFDMINSKEIILVRKHVKFYVVKYTTESLCSATIYVPLDFQRFFLWTSRVTFQEFERNSLASAWTRIMFQIKSCIFIWTATANLINTESNNLYKDIGIGPTQFIM